VTGRRRRGLLALFAVLLAAVGLLVTGGLRGALGYYRTPTEVLDSRPPASERVRLAGTVVPGSVRETGTRTVFRVTDGRRTVTVDQHGTPPGAFGEGRDAVVEGVLRPDGVFESDTVMVRHSNEYRAKGRAG
jgi:cytochrome c-type biogenesis protein CcmE